MSLFQKLMMTDIKKEESTLPSDYTQLEYIESTGTQYIDTGIYTKRGYNIDIDLQLNALDSDLKLLGTRDAGSFGLSTLSRVWRPNINYNFAISNIPTSTNKVNITFDINKTTWVYTLKVDGVLDTSGNATAVTDTTSSTSFYLFGLNGASLSAYKIYKCILFDENSNKVFNGIPAKRNSDSEIGMYDTVTETFFTNAGTGTFTAGAEIAKYPLEIPKVSYDNNAIDYSMYGESSQSWVTIDGTEYHIPTGYTVLDYIESTGTQYIDTGYVWTSNVATIETDIYRTENVTAGHGIYGVQVGTKHALTFYHAVSVSTSYIAYFGTETIASLTIDLQKWIHIKHDCTDSSYSIAINDVISTGTSTISLQNTNSTWLFTSHYNTGTDGYAKIRMRNFRMIDNGTLVRNFIPAKRNSDSEIGMYDFVTNTFYTNAGTGTFTAGNTSPCPDRPIDVVSVGDKTINLFNTDSSVWTTGTYATLKVCESTELAYIKIFDNDTSVDISGCYLGWRKEGTTSDIFWLIQNGQYSSTYAGNTTGVTGSYRGELCIYYGSGSIEGLNKLKQRFNLSCTKGSTIPSSYIPYGYQIPTVVGSNCGCVDLRTKTVEYVTSETQPNFHIFTLEITTSNQNAYIYGYTQTTDWNVFWNSDKVFLTRSHIIYIRNTSYTNADAFKDTLKYLYYQRSTDDTWTTPTTTTTYLSDQLRKVGTYADYIDYENQQVVRNVGVKVLDGTENWSKTSKNSYGITTFYSSIINSYGQTTETYGRKSTHYQEQPLTASEATTYGFTTDYANVYIRDTIETISDWTTYLATQYANGTPVVVIYPLATSTTETDTDLPAIPLKAGTDEITVNTTVIPSAMNLKAWQWRF